MCPPYLRHKNLMKKKKHSGDNLRIAMLSLYDKFTSGREIRIDENELRKIANKYYEVYRKLGGSISFNELQKDYLIIAAASKNNMDLVVSNDRGTMLSELSINSYALVNKALKLRNPQFIDYQKFKKLMVT